MDEATLRELTSEANRPAKGTTKTVFDLAIQSFAVRISPEGRATFCMVYSFGGRIRRYTIDQWRTPEMARRVGARGMTLAVAREEATALRVRIAGSNRIPPEDIAGKRTSEKAGARAEREHKAAQAEASKYKATATFGALLQAYVDHKHETGRVDWKQTDAAIRRHITEAKPRLAAKPADEISVDDVMPIFHSLAKAGKHNEARKLRAYLRAAYASACKARTSPAMHAFVGFRIKVNPLSGIALDKPKQSAMQAKEAAKNPAKWALSEEQLAAYWQRISAMDDAHGALLRFHLLTGGQRGEQLTRLTVDDLDEAEGVITIYDTKGPRAEAYVHKVPLIPDAKKALDAMRGNEGPFIFTVSAGRHGAVYHTLRDLMREVAVSMKKDKEVHRLFTPGIIRKTVETRLMAVDVSKEVRASLLSHGRGGVQERHYEAHEYLDEKRAALRKLRQLCDGAKKQGKAHAGGDRPAKKPSRGR